MPQLAGLECWRFVCGRGIIVLLSLVIFLLMNRKKKTELKLLFFVQSKQISNYFNLIIQSTYFALDFAVANAFAVNHIHLMLVMEMELVSTVEAEY